MSACYDAPVKRRSVERIHRKSAQDDINASNGLPILAEGT